MNRIDKLVAVASALGLNAADVLADAVRTELDRGETPAPVAPAASPREPQHSEPKRATKAPKPAAPKTEKRERATPEEQARLEERVLEAAASIPEAFKADDLAELLADVYPTRIGNALAKFVSAGKLAKFGSKRNTTYSVPRDAKPAAVAEAAE